MLWGLVLVQFPPMLTGLPDPGWGQGPRDFAERYLTWVAGSAGGERQEVCREGRMKRRQGWVSACERHAAGLEAEEGSDPGLSWFQVQRHSRQASPLKF